MYDARPGRPVFRDPAEEGGRRPASPCSSATIDDTFGFGVVFSTRPHTFETMIAKATAPTSATSPIGATSRSIFAAPRTARRQRVLRPLARHAVEDSAAARALASRFRNRPRYRRSIQARGADLVVVADYINSRIGEAFADRFEPSADL
jgi:hypothetical protein